MIIRKAGFQDLEAIFSIYAYARRQMALSGNPSQWGKDKPTSKTILQDIQQGSLFLMESDGQAVGVFAFWVDEEPTYQTIEGKWENDLPYGVIHRIASNGRQTDILVKCLDFCSAFTNNLRIDTHEDNHIMRHLLKKNGFAECGMIYVEDGTPRIAFQRYCFDS